MKNIENIKKVLDHIEKNPNLWYQRDWHCGTSHCFAGWAEIFAIGEVKDNTNTRQIARIYFGFTLREADYYFNGARTLEELKTAIKPFFDDEGWGKDGFDRNGYDREGYDCYGYNREGYNRFGYDRYGFDKDGYDKYGYNNNGYDRYGYNREGYDREGYDTDGLDRNNKPKVSELNLVTQHD